MNRSGRIIGIDLVRSVAICGAMLSHVVVMTGLTLPAPAADHLFRIALQTSAPIFIVLFGSMLELAYRPKFVPGGRADVAARLIARALQCWALYALSVVALIFLPLTFFTGLLGINVEGIWYADHPQAINGVLIICAAIATVLSAFFFIRRWIGK